MWYFDAAATSSARAGGLDTGGASVAMGGNQIKGMGAVEGIIERKKEREVIERSTGTTDKVARHRVD